MAFKVAEKLSVDCLHLLHYNVSQLENKNFKGNMLPVNNQINELESGDGTKPTKDYDRITIATNH